MPQAFVLRFGPWVAIMVFSAVMLAGIGGCDDEKAKGAGATVEGPYADVLDALCNTISRCPNAAGRPFAYRNRNECIAILNFAFTCRLTEIDAPGSAVRFGVKELRPDINAAQSAACVAWLNTASCDAIERGGDNTPCSQAFDLPEDDDGHNAGTAKLDESCTSDASCLANLYCTPEQLDREQGSVACRVCKPRHGEGAACSQYTRQCQDGLHCTYQEDDARRCAPLDADDAVCVDSEQCTSGFCNYTLQQGGGWGKCDSGGVIGAPCDEATESQGLGSSCRQPYYCDAGSCRARRSVGEPCRSDYACERYRCDQEAGLCGVADGQRCSEHEDCRSQVCFEGTCGGPPGACSADSQCADDETCAGLCRPPNCSCSGCPTGICTSKADSSPSCVDDFDCDSNNCLATKRCGPAAVIGSACTDDFRCYPLGYCANNVCVERPGPGQECTRIDTCQEPFLCVEERCQIMNLICKPARAGQRCAALRVCDDASYCDLFDGVTCKPRAAADQPCSQSRFLGVDNCIKGFFCMADDSGESSCKPRPKLGEACSGVCTEGSYCFESVCQADPIGRPCHSSGSCPDALYCHDRQEVCLPRLGKGAACDRWDQSCRSEYICGSSNTCEDRLALDARCDDTIECAQNLYCSRDNYTCQLAATAGQPCDHSTPCVPGLRCSSSERICEPAATAGESCSSAADCQSGVCYQYSFCQATAACTMP